MSILIYCPRPPLDRYIKLFWHRNAEPGIMLRETKEVILPDGCAHLIINLSHDHIRLLERMDCEIVTTCGGSTFFGPSSSPYAVLPSGSTVMGVSFRPGGAFPFLSAPLEQYQNLPVPARLILGARAAELRDRLALLATAPQRFALIEQFLLHSLRPPVALHRAVAYAIRAFEEASIKRISEILAATGLSERHFSQLFSNQVGLSPKRFHRVRRFQKTVASLASRRESNWAETALEAGYYDQAHLIHEFRIFSSVTPRAFVASRVVQRSHLSLPI